MKRAPTKEEVYRVIRKVHTRITAETLAKKLGAHRAWNTVEMHLEKLAKEGRISRMSFPQTMTYYRSRRG